jgi:hypothetical protein
MSDFQRWSEFETIVNGIVASLNYKLIQNSLEFENLMLWL